MKKILRGNCKWSLAILVVASVLVTSSSSTFAQTITARGSVVEGFFNPLSGELGPSFFIDDRLGIGNNDNGELDIRSGGIVGTRFTEVGTGQDFGRLRISGFGSRLSTTSSAGLRLGNASLEVSGGGVLAIANANGTLSTRQNTSSTISVSGTGSTIRSDLAELANREGQAVAVNVLGGAQFRIGVESSLGADFDDATQGGLFTARVNGQGSVMELGDRAALGSSRPGLASMLIENNGRVAIDQTFKINEKGTVTLDGGILEGRGESGTAIEVRGTIGGDGTIVANTTKLNGSVTSATPKLNVGPGETLRFSAFNQAGSALRLENRDGEVNIDNGTLDVDGNFVNSFGGRVNARNANIHSTDSIINRSEVRFLEGENRVNGQVVNQSEINLGGESRVSFFDEVVNDSTIAIANGSEAIFHDRLTGDGGFAGGGEIKIFGELDVAGDEAIAAIFGLDRVELDQNAFTTIDIFGNQLGEEFDHIDIEGEFALGGTLQIRLQGEFAPLAGSSFDLFDFGSVSGDFDEILLPNLGPELLFDTGQLRTTGVLSVVSAVPEPGSGFLVFALGVVFIAKRRR